MARNSGIIKFNGKLGNMVGYKRKGKQVLQQPGGFTAERMATEDRYESTRQRQTEFGLCGQQSVMIKQNLQHFLEYIPDTYMFNHIQSMMLKVKECDVDSPKGQKTVLKGLKNTNGQRLFETFSFNRKCRIRSVVAAPFEVDMENGRLTIPKLNPETHLRFAKKREQLGLHFALLRIDLAQDLEKGIVLDLPYSESELMIFSKDCPVEDVVFDAEIPDGEGMLVGLLFAGVCETSKWGVEWFINKGCVLEVVGVVYQ